MRCMSSIKLLHEEPETPVVLQRGEKLNADLAVAGDFCLITDEAARVGMRDRDFVNNGMQPSSIHVGMAPGGKPDENNAMEHVECVSGCSEREKLHTLVQPVFQLFSFNVMHVGLSLVRHSSIRARFHRTTKTSASRLEAAGMLAGVREGLGEKPNDADCRVSAAGSRAGRAWAGFGGLPLATFPRHRRPSLSGSFLH